MAKTNIKFNNKNYSIENSLLADATAKLEAHFTAMINGAEVLEGDGAEYYTLAPTPLSFRSTAPLSELQEVTINGEVVDPSNYTLEEGSTIVTFPIEYLKTLDVGSYEVDVVSESKTVKGGFTVATPQLNEHGFYYNQPYTGYVSYYNQNWVFFLREDGTMDVTVLDNEYVETCSYVADGNNLTITAVAGTFTGTASEAGIYCNELATNFVVSDQIDGITITNRMIVSDQDYIYKYNQDLDGFIVTKVIDKTKHTYNDIRTSIFAKPTISIGTVFRELTNLVNVPKLPNSITSIEAFAFEGCSNLTSIEIPTSITSIGRYAFNNCTSLTRVIIPASVTTVGEHVFSDCASLVNIDVESENANYSSVDGVFFNKNKTILLKYPMSKPESIYTIPDSTTVIEYAAFRGCANLKNVILHDNITNIYQSAFSDCTNLQSIIFPASDTNIDSLILSGCTNLQRVVIPASVTFIYGAAFYDCSMLFELIFNGTTEQWKAIRLIGSNHYYNVPATHVHCTDGDVAL